MIKARKAVLSYSVKDKQNIESLGESCPSVTYFVTKRRWLFLETSSDIRNIPEGAIWHSAGRIFQNVKTDS